MVVFEVAALLAAVVGIYLAADQTRISNDALADQKRMSSLQLLQSPTISALPKLRALEYLLDHGEQIEGIEIVCVDQRFCGDYDDLKIADTWLLNVRLNGLRLVDFEFRYVNFRYSDLSNIFFLKGTISGVDFFDTDLSDSYLGSVEVDGTYFAGANLTGASIAGGRFKNAGFPGTNISSVELCRPFATFSGSLSAGRRVERLTQRGCAQGIDAIAFEDAFFITGHPPQNADLMPDFENALVWECPPEVLNLDDFNTFEDAGTYCRRIRIGGPPR